MEKILEEIFLKLKELPEDVYSESFKNKLKYFANQRANDYLKKLEKYFEDLYKLINNQKFIIYGAGEVAKIFLKHFCEKYKIYPKVILDKKVSSILNFSVVKFPDDVRDKYKDYFVIISVYNKSTSENIKKELHELGFKKVYTLVDLFSKKILEILYKYCGYQYLNSSYELELFVNNYEKKSRDFYLKNLNKILKTYSLLSDKLSKKIFIKALKQFILLEFKEEISPWEKEELQYFPKDIKFSKGYDIFIDCGAYIGDTLESLIKNVGKVKEVICFEPNLSVYMELTKYIKKNKGKIAENIIALPLGVGKEEKFVKFEYLKKGSSRISTHGNLLIWVSSLDRLLCGVKPTFIKMDIEGGELDALKGAENLIKEHKPDLAICIYHEPSHFWEIPLFLHELVPEYKFYLRKYSPFFIVETVLYATI